MKTTLTAALAVAMLNTLFGQTPPQKPNTTPIPATPPLVLPGPPTPDAIIGTKPLSADEAALIALKLQPNVTVALAQAAEARGEVQQAMAALLPTVSATGDYSILQNFDVKAPAGTIAPSSRSSGFTATATVNQLIFDFDRTMDQVRAAKATAKAADYNLTATQSNLIFQVKQQFYTVAQNLQLVAVFEADVKSNKDQLDLTVGELSAGLGAPSDVVTAFANLANATSSLVQARSTYLLSRITLAALIGVDPRTPLVLANSKEPANNSQDLNALVDAGLRNRPEILQAEETLRAAGYSVSVARKQLLPSLGFFGSVSSPSVGTDVTYDSSAIGIELTWKLFDGGLSAGEVASAKAVALEARANLTAATQTVVSDVSSAYVSIQAAEQGLQVAASGVANAEEGLRLSEGRYKAGVTTFTEVTTAQATLVTAQSSLATAESQLETARAQMSKAIGTSIKPPMPSELKPIMPSNSHS